MILTENSEQIASNSTVKIATAATYFLRYGPLVTKRFFPFENIQTSIFHQAYNVLSTKKEGRMDGHCRKQGLLFSFIITK